MSKERPSIQDVAREAETSQATITRYLSPRTRHTVRADLRARIELAIQKLGYKPMAFARLRRALRKYNIGVLTSLSKDIIHSGYHMGIMAGIVDQIFRTGHDLKLFRMKEKQLARAEDLFGEYGVDGLIVITWRFNPHLIHLIENCPADLPLVVMNDFESNLKTNILYTDVREGMKIAVSYLAGRGYKRIGYLARPKAAVFETDGKELHQNCVDAEEKLKGFQEGIKENKLLLKPQWIRECVTYREADAYNKMKEWIEEGNLPRAICCGNDDIAIGALKALKEAKLWCPEKIALMGFDDIEKGKVISPSLTTVKQPLYQIGQDAVGLVIDKIEFGDEEAVQRRYVPEIVARQTA
ncbi:MAG TPA: LacI family DNA-binding transcriptional regulator [Candidatus Omnitrophota bacterium]|nr:LacI family DNA-binding transcriptional regulator [Candidatus Omnitrophota bacterium]